MQSSTAVFLRAGVMLGVLIVLPAYALLGTSLPEKLLPVLERLTKDAEQQAGGGLRPSPSTPEPYAAAASAWPVGSPTAGDDHALHHRAELSESHSPNRLVSWEEPAPRSAAGQPSPNAAYLDRRQGEPQGASRGFRAVKRGVDSRGVDSPAASALPLKVSAIEPMRLGTATVRVSDEGRRALPPDGFSRRAQALWEVGATHITVSIERPGRTPSYWCSCQVVGRRERFEAAAGSALGSMDKVLEQVRTWRAAAAQPRR
ncbi:MAG: hypothetical protein IID44_04425 [Planctomycetes bacterium]|nr:hypothetical protein [Planctomycetota bacterium]